ncbi:acyltransferase [uncultured Microbacterium sp.]|uniref:acyltransferase family protein n=1 Tax=uncultured Microbacterium sp. TaxID=191216 RepID=UPI00263363C4|nr:acyltransferase [uncultured Microbacterium sp.]
MAMKDTTKQAVSVRELFVRGRPNSLNLIRLALAAAVIVWHSYAALGLPYPAPEFRNLLGALPVNGFFAISGFLIYRSWQNKPRVWDFLVARVVRIYPAFWACLIVTALVVAPIAVLLQGGSPLLQAFSVESLTYVLKNATLAMFQWRIGDSPTEIPYTVSWNASLWTLAWEFLCYLGLMVLGLLGMLRRRWLLAAAFAISIALNLLQMIPLFAVEVIERVGRFSVFFLAGAIVAQYSHRIRANWVVTIAALTLMTACAWGPPSAIVIQAPATALGLILLGGLANPKWAELRNDISYGVYIYAFPIQQLLVVAGATGLGLVWFSTLAFTLTVPFAAISWFVIEKPALKLRSALGYRPWFKRAERLKS